MCIFRFSRKHHLVCFLSLLNYGDIGSVLIKHLQIVIPLSYPCYYTNLCPHKPHKPAHTHTHTHTHTHREWCLRPWAISPHVEILRRPIAAGAKGRLAQTGDRVRSLTWASKDYFLQSHAICLPLSCFQRDKIFFTNPIQHKSGKLKKQKQIQPGSWFVHISSSE